MSNHRTSSLGPPYPDIEAPSHFFEKLEQNSPDAKWESLYKVAYRNSTAQALLHGIFTNSPYLGSIILRHPEWLEAILFHGLEESFREWSVELNSLPPDLGEAELMKRLRLHKMKGALLIAWADISNRWPLERVTETLSSLAERVLEICVDFLLQQLVDKGAIEIESLKQSGLIVLGMGKLGGKELNYSSDVDLILLFDSEKMTYLGNKSLQHVLNRLAQDLSRLMQERTAEGYVFRTDLRLRPDPASTPPIVNRDAAIRYYESVGQNWERAAFTKARPVAGDRDAAEAFLQELKPFIWRRNLDFAAIADIQAVRKQMSGGDTQIEEIEGHNIKTGLGGIREIEFIAHTFQLIWGGKQPQLRTLSTCATLKQACELGLLQEDEFTQLVTHYRFLREVEHRLQMMDDQQTHTIPTNHDELAKLSQFCGFLSTEAFAAALLEHLRVVHTLYLSTIDSESDVPDNSTGPLVFTGVDADPSTLASLKKMGFHAPEVVIEEIQNWHRGNIRAMRQLRARQLLTKLTPALLLALSKTTSPDQSFQNFTKFLSGLPSGIQLFSLFSTNLQLLDYIAAIMGYAPQLAEQFTRHPEWIEILLTDDLDESYYQRPDPRRYLLLSHHPDDEIRWLCRFRNEWEFLTGTRLLRNKISPEEAMHYLTQAADAALESLVELVWERFKERYGQIDGSDFAIIALGRLGSKEVTFGSDLDLVFVFDAQDLTQLSGGEKQIAPSLYYNRLCQRIVGASQALTPAGRLYEIDTRLRPGGESQGLVVHYDMFHRYYQQDAWTFEKMALLRHRVVYGSKRITDKIEHSIQHMLRQPRPVSEVKTDILTMRRKMIKSFGWDQMWDVKHARGGLIDITFIAQYLALCHGYEHSALLCSRPIDIIAAAQDHDIICADIAQQITQAWSYQERLHTMLRLCHEDFTGTDDSAGFKELLSTLLGATNITEVKKTLNLHQNNIYDQFTKLIGKIELHQGENT